MGPVAKKVLKELRKQRSSDVVSLDAIRAGLRDRDAFAEQLSPELTEGERAWMLKFFLISRLGDELLGLDALRKLRNKIDRFEEHYMPGGPPMSPVLDSVFAHWWLADATVGSARETLASILVEIGRALRAPTELVEATRTLASSFRGFYVVRGRAGGLLTVEDLLTRAPFALDVDDDYEAVPGQVWWTRLFPVDEARWTSLGAPYVFRAPTAADELRAYFGRALGSPDPRRYRDFLKRGASPEFWMDYIMDAYAGSDDMVVFLRGVPDRPSTLPHATAHEPAGDPEAEANPLVRGRERLVGWMASRGLLEPAIDEFRHARTSAGLGESDLQEWEPWERIMTQAFAMYGWLDDAGRSALDLALADPTFGIDPEARAALERVQAGWFSLFEVDHIRIDEAIEVKDRLRRKNLTILERSGTRQVSLGDVLVGWVTTEPDGTHQLEGGGLHVPHWLAETHVAAVRHLNQQLRRRWPRLSASKRAGLLAPYAAAFLMRLLRERPMPDVYHQTSGEKLVGCKAHFSVSDAGAVLAALEAAPDFDELTPSSWAWADSPLPTKLSLQGKDAELESLDRASFEAAKERLQELAGSALVHRVDAFQDLHRLVDERREAPRGRDEKPAIDPEIAAEVVRHALVEHMRRWVDQALPALDGKSPRQAVRTQRGREKVEALLLGQERAIARMPNAPPVDLGFVRSELGLVGQGQTSTASRSARR